MEKKPFVTKEIIEKAVQNYPTPFHIYDENGIRENARNLHKAFAWNKGFREYFAVKANPNPEILRILNSEGCGLDCSSYTELMLADKLDIPGEYIMFSSNMTPAEEYRYADKLGAIVNLDDFTHIDFFETSTGHIPETISCRFNPGGEFKISNDIMDNPGDAKYGFTYEQLRDGYIKLRNMGAKNFGIHAFLASNTLTNDYYPALAALMFETVVKIKEETGICISFVNLSGGIGVPYRPEDNANDIFKIGEGVREQFERILKPAGLSEVKIFTELGRYMLAPFGALVSKAVHKKDIYKNYIGLDACAVDLMRPAMYGSYHHITVLGKEDAPNSDTYDIVGSLCENNDKFAIDRRLPHIDIGDYLYIHDTGGHGYSMGYNYNGKLRSAELMLKQDGTIVLIRRAETPEDYFATLTGITL